MLTLTLTPQLPNSPFQSCHLTLPTPVTFHHLHAALEIILQPDYGCYYSFMLMTSHHAIEANTAADYKIVPAFKQNPQIRYLNPYPGTFICLLELEGMDDSQASPYPQVKGTNNDKQINLWLKEYCHFTKSWQYQNEDFFRKLYQREQQKINEQRAKEQRAKKQNQSPALLSVPRIYHFKTMEDKQHAWDSFCMMYEDAEGIRVTVGTSKNSQAELLGMSKKENLLNYCRYSGVPVGANWRKKQLAEAFCHNLQENIWLSMLYLPKEGLNLYFRLCRLKDNQKLSINPEEEEALKVLIYLGIVDVSLGNKETNICLELSADFKKSFSKFFKSSHNFGPRSECTLYLSPELKAGSWQKIVKGYEKLDCRVSMLLCTYGILSVEDLCTKLCTCYEYSFSRAEFERYLMIHLRLLEQVYTGHTSGSRERIASPMELDISYALRVQKALVPISKQRHVDSKELDTFGDRIPELTEGLMQLLANFTEDIYLLSDISSQLLYAVLGNYTWNDYLEPLEELLDDLENVEQIGFWYELSKLYLYLPVAGLGGYCRKEYAINKQLENPYLVLNDFRGFQEEQGDESIFALPFDVQWQIFSYAERFIEDGNELSEKRMVKYARKHLTKEMVDGLQIYCYLSSGNPKLLKVLEKGAEQGIPQAKEMLEAFQDMLKGIYEEWESYE